VLSGSVNRLKVKKALMFEELGHRTKNNLHMIASVLGLQARELRCS
jgi:two-component sensor histidine kinase